MHEEMEEVVWGSELRRTLRPVDWVVAGIEWR